MVAVSGASGILGFGVCEQILEEKKPVKGIVRSSKALFSSKSYTEVEYDLLSGDVLRLKGILDSCDAFIHCANNTPSALDQGSLGFFEDSVKMGFTAIRGFMESACPIMILISSAAVYPILPSSQRIVEEDYETGIPPRSKATYATVKKLLEYVLLEEAEKLGKQVYILRPTNIFGYCPDVLNKAQFIPSMIKKLGKNIPIDFINGTKHTRDFIYSKDIGIACIKIMERKPDRSIFTICSEEDISLVDAVKKLADVMNVKALIEDHVEVNGSYMDVRYSHEKITTALNWEPRYGFQTALQEMTRRIDA